jgi:hypothetical protein
MVSIDQLTGCLGFSSSGVDRAVSSGWLHRLHRGVYAVGHTNLSLQGQCLAAVFACGDGALLSHYSAAWLWGLVKGSPVPIEVTTPIPRKLHLPVRRHHSRILVADDYESREGIPVTGVPRTLLDLAARVRSDRLRRILERAEELRVLDLAPIAALLDRSRGHRGRRPLREAIALYRPPSFTRSDLERRFLDLVLAAGLPRPATNFVEAGYELDAYWQDRRFAVELDVYETHGTREAFERDRIRQEDLKLAGIEMIRVTGTRLEREPSQVVGRVARLLRGRTRSLQPAGRTPA